MLQTSSCKPLSISPLGAGISATMASKSGAMLLEGLPKLSVAQPCFALAKMILKSNCSSVAPNSMNSSMICSVSSTSSNSPLSILFTTTSTFLPRPSAFFKTYLVCGIQPSMASTSKSTPSTMDKMRSTSPPKSAWPGVSMMLIFFPL